MIKRISILMSLVTFLFLSSCQNEQIDNVHEFEPATQNKMIKGEIQHTSKEIIQKMLKQLPEAMPSGIRPPIDFDQDTFGCVTFIDGFVFIDEDCEIKSGIPDIFDDCDIVARGTVDCGVWIDRPDCIICVMWFVAECDGELRWTYGYNIICTYSNPQEY